MSILESEEVEYILLLKSFIIIMTTFEDFSLYVSQVCFYGRILGKVIPVADLGVALTWYYKMSLYN